jgi:hypothetical protein
MQISTAKNTASTSSLQEGQQYVFRVASRDASGNLVWSAFSDAFTAQNVATGGITWATEPAASNSTGNAGEIAYGSGYFFLHDGTEWRRAALSPFGVIPPTITIDTQPQSLTLASGGSGNFTISATVSDGATPTYQWQNSDDSGATWDTLTGSTGTTYSLSGVSAVDSGTQYRAVISAAGADDVTSNVATLTVTADRILAENSDTLLTETGDNLLHDGDPQVWAEVGGNISQPTASQFGSAVALDDDGDVAVIGAYLDNNGGSTANGTLSVYGFTNGSWSQIGSKLIGEADGDRFGGYVASNGDGSVVAAIAEYNSETYSRQGHARVFAWDGTDWQQRGLDLDGDQFNPLGGMRGLALSESGSRIALGWLDSDDGTGSPDRGIVRAYDWDGSAWQQAGATLSGSGTDSGFGRVALSSSGEVLVIGEPQSAQTPAGSGKFQVFDWVGGTSWQQRGSDITGSSSGESLGLSVSSSSDGNRICAGGVGVVKIYDWSGSAWEQVGGDIVGDGDDAFGVKTKISGDGSRVVVGSYLEDVNAQGNAGVVRTYELQGNVWQLVGSSISTEVVNDRLGNAVDITNDGSLIAAGTNAQKVYFFSTD